MREAHGEQRKRTAVISGVGEDLGQRSPDKSGILCLGARRVSTTAGEMSVFQQSVRRPERPKSPCGFTLLPQDNNTSQPESKPRQILVSLGFSFVFMNDDFSIMMEFRESLRSL